MKFFCCLFFIVCFSGIINIIVLSGILVYFSLGDYGINEIKCWGIEFFEIYEGIYYIFNRYVFLECCLIWYDNINSYSFVEMFIN